MPIPILINTVPASGVSIFFYPKIGFFLKPYIRDLIFFKNANLVFIEKSEFFLKILDEALHGPKEALKGLGSPKKRLEG